jgi:hypothetical protein
MNDVNKLYQNTVLCVYGPSYNIDWDTSKGIIPEDLSELKKRIYYNDKMDSKLHNEISDRLVKTRDNLSSKFGRIFKKKLKLIEEKFESTEFSL